MADTFGLKIGIEGEKEFKKSLADINRSFKVLGSEMKLVSSQFAQGDNSVEALAAKHRMLGKEIDAQKQKIAMLRKALENASSSFGENDRRTQQWRIQLNNAEAALNDMERELQDSARQADNLGDELTESGNAAEKSEKKFSGLGQVLKSVGLAMGSFALAAGAVAIKVGKEVVEQFGELEQNLGGSEAVFGAYASSIQKTGEEAYKNLGLSQSDYLATANKMGALFQGSGLSQERSLELTTQAMQRAADMASVMGIDMSMAMESVAGAAKGNFTMMDNLGVAMNATNIEAYALSKGLDFCWNKATQAEKAEIAMQMFLENTAQYAGNFADESTRTISGSIGLLEAALSSFTAGLGNADADMQNLTANLIDAFQVVVKNVTPVIENLVAALPMAITAILEALFQMLPSLLNTFNDLFSQILNTLLTLTPQFIPIAVDALMSLVDTLIANLPLLVEVATQLVVALVSGLGAAMPQLVPAAVQAILTIVEGLIGNLPLILDAALQLISGLARGLVAALPMIIKALPTIINGIVDFLINSIPIIIETGIQLLIALVTALPEIIAAIVEAMPLIIEGIVGALLGNIGEIISAGVTLLVALIADLPYIISAIVKAVPQIVSGIVGAFGSQMSRIVEVGRDMVRGLWQGIQALSSWIWEKVTSWASGIWDGICSVFQIHSPSRKMAWVGDMLVRGLAESIDENGGKAVKSAVAMSGNVSSVFTGLANSLQHSVPTSFDFSANANLSSAVTGREQNVVTQIIRHIGTIQVEGINSSGELTDVVDIVIDRLRGEVRV